MNILYKSRKIKDVHLEVITPCALLCKCRCFEGTFCFLFQGRKWQRLPL